MSELKSKHAFGSEANVSTAIQMGLIDEWDIIFFNEGKLGWLDKNKNLTMLKIPESVKTVSKLPARGENDTVYICGSMLYFWTGTNFKSVMAESSGGISEDVVDAKLDSLEAELREYIGGILEGVTTGSSFITNSDGEQIPSSFFVTENNSLSAIPVKDGQVIFINDQKRIAFDIDGVRTVYSQVLELVNDSDRLAIKNAIDNTFYFVSSTARLWMYRRGNWIPVTSETESPVYIGGNLPEVGQDNILYVDKVFKTISIWDNTLMTYVTIANMGSGRVGDDGVVDMDAMAILQEQITMARRDAIAQAQEYTIQQTGLMELAITTATDEKILIVQQDIDTVEESVAAHTEALSAVQSELEETNKTIRAIDARITQLEEDDDDVIEIVSFTTISDDEIDAMFKVY